MKKTDLINKLENVKARSAWDKGVKDYAIDLVDGLESDEVEKDTITEEMLNGARDWQQYSEGGMSLVYNYDIANALCNPTELKRTRNGELTPNAFMDWIDLQARALEDAERLIKENM